MYLAIDLWDKRCGIAVYVDPIVIPKEIVSRASLISNLRKYIIQYDIKEIIVGLPYDLYWRELKQLEKTQNFIEKLKNIFPKQKIIWVDERFTSQEADYILKECWIKDTQWKKDSISASIILETYLTRKQ